MIMIRAIIRPEKVDDVMEALLEAGFSAVTRMDVVGRGKQKGMRVGNTTYDVLPKELLMICVREKEKDFVTNTIIEAAKSSPSGAYGDGKIFISPVDEVITISSGIREVAEFEPKLVAIS